MSSKATVYRKEHPEYYEKERIKDNERVKKLYHKRKICDFLCLSDVTT